jgi:tRNA(Ile)-lysidine synthase
VLNQFALNIQNKNLFTKNDKLLLAFSGGVDSVVLAYLLKHTGFNFDLAHCNFQLRGNEANDDANFCENISKQLNVKFNSISFDTKNYAKENKLSIQMAARQLRYNWFEELRVKNNYSYILTAHHANDVIETLFVNLTRGTGIKGLQGILEKQKNIIRPLLFATKQNILLFANENNLQYRDDSSNQEIKYKRNYIRHQILPQLKLLNPAFETTLLSSIQFFKQSAEIVNTVAKEKYKLICTEKNNQLYINIDLLLKELYKETLLFEWLNEKGFKHSQIIQLTEVIINNRLTGKQFSSSTHQLVVDRNSIIVQPIQKNEVNEFQINSINETEDLPIQLKFEILETAVYSANKNEVLIDIDTIRFPLTLRKWKTGDKFKPLGMNGTKKLSDYFKDEKLSLFDKQDVWILCDKKQIIWVVSYRLDDRCKVTDNTKCIARIRIQK